MEGKKKKIDINKFGEEKWKMGMGGGVRERERKWEEKRGEGEEGDISVYCAI